MYRFSMSEYESSGCKTTACFSGGFQYLIGTPHVALIIHLMYVTTNLNLQKLREGSQKMQLGGGGGGAQWANYEGH